MSGAWQAGARFFTARPLYNLILIFGIGVLIPIALQLLFFGLSGGPTGGAPAEAGEGAELSAADAAALIVLGGTFVLQAATYFAAWRLGFGNRESFGGALLFGLVAGLIAAAASAVLLFAAGMAAAQAGPPGIVVFVILFTLLPVMLALAIFYTFMAALIGTGVALLLVLAMVLGTSSGDLGLAATMVGGSGFVVVMLLVLSVLLLWLTARLSCTTVVMADRKSYNPFAAMRASWELTWEAQWQVMGYLALVALGCVILLIALVAAVGAGTQAMQGGESPTAAGIGGLVVGVAMGLGFSLLAVMLPAGIYRQLAGERAPVEVFA